MSSSASSSTSSSSSSNPSNSSVSLPANLVTPSTSHLRVSSRRIRDLIHDINPAESCEPEVEALLLELADDFVEEVAAFSCALARQRKSNVVEVKDVAMHLEKNWNIRIDGYPSSSSSSSSSSGASSSSGSILGGGGTLLSGVKPLRRPIITDAHKKRLAAVNKYKQQLKSQAQQNLGGNITNSANGVGPLTSNTQAAGTGTGTSGGGGGSGNDSDGKAKKRKRDE